jgi:putative DNA primase/helicase
MSFDAAMRAAGLFPRDIVADGKWRRCATAHKPKKKNGAYMLTIDGRRGYFKDYANDTDWNTWHDDRPMTMADHSKHERKLRELRQQEARRRAAAIRSMRAYFFALPPLRGGHPYLDGKGLSMRGCEGLRVDGDALVIPMWTGADLMSVQTIDPAGAKLYRAGCPVAGASFAIGDAKPAVTCWAEGFATGLAVHQCVPQARVVVCFDAGNLVRVAKASKARGLAVVCADNDWQGSTNTGVEKGRQAADAIGCGLAYPQGIGGTDWADAFREWGASKVRLEVLREAAYVASG